MHAREMATLAYALRKSKPPAAVTREDMAALTQWRTDVAAIGAALANDNPRFDLSRFLEHIGPA